MQECRDGPDTSPGAGHAGEMSLDAVAVLGPSRRIPPGYVFLGAGMPDRVELARAVGRNRAIDFQGTRLTLGAVQAAQDAVSYDADELIRIAERISCGIAGNSRQPRTVKALGVCRRRDP